MEPPTVVGIVWYRQKDYERLKRMFPDGYTLDDTFSDWLKNAQRVSGELTAQGFTVVKAYVDPEICPGWCEARGVPMDRQARSDYAREYAQRGRVTKRRKPQAR